MAKTSILLVSLSLICLSWSLSCAPGFIPHPNQMECLKGCIHPDFQNCQPFFITIFNSSFCGLKDDGTWKSFTFECQACAQTGFIGVRQGKCTCEQLGCPSGQQCKNGVCQTITDPCYPQVSSPVGCILSCDDPEFDNCPPFFTQQYNPSFCAWTTDRTWVNYTHKCQGCLDSKSVGIMDGACSCEQLGCPFGFVCINRQCRRINSNQCSTNQQCKDYEFCLDGICTDKCALIRCLVGRCQKGQCLSFCNQAISCPFGQQCINEGCIDKCASVSCPVNVPCVNGECVGRCANDNQCKSFEICNNGACLDKCALILCSSGLICQKGQCIQPTCSVSSDCPFQPSTCFSGRCRNGCLTNSDCAQGQLCNVNFCIDKCALVKCSTGLICKNGDCVKPTCSVSLDCPFQPSTCFSGRCRNGCLTNSDCGVDQLCNVNFCIDKCEIILCSPGLVCEKGSCVSPICSTSADCSFQPSGCINGKCVVDPCLGVVCPLGLTCINGKCPQCQSQNDCQSPQICQQGQCVDKCAGIRCSFGYRCEFGNCVLDQSMCRSNLDCSFGFQCLSGKCVDKCSRVFCFSGQCVNGQCPRICQFNSQCKDGQVCNNNICKDACDFVQCPQKSKCDKGVCRPQLQICPAKSEKPKTKAAICTDPRPTEEECPIINYFAEPEYLFCGVKRDGTRVNFPVECDACRDKTILYYFDQPCEEVPDYICNLNQKCQDDACVNEDPCFPEVSSPAGCILSCQDELFGDCPDVFIQVFIPQFCAWTEDKEWKNFTLQCEACTTDGVKGILQGKCSCDNIKCYQGQSCFEGKCIPDFACRRDSDCPSGSFCSGGGCVDKCIVTLCPENTICEGGNCLPLPCQNNIDCPNGYSCSGGRCRDNCAFIRCPANTVCKGGNCIPISCQSNNDCSTGFFCLGGACVDRCRITSCPTNTICQGGQCLPRPCSSNSDCPTGYSCSGGSCIDNCAFIRCPANTVCKGGNCVPKSCQSSNDCSTGFFCSGGVCADLCIVTTCPTNTNCQGGQCIPKRCSSSADCGPNQRCDAGGCLDIVSPAIAFCPASAEPDVVYCRVRPTEQECPTVVYIRPPDSLVCGVKSNGQRVDFPRRCQACKDISIQYYMEIPCDFAPFVCQSGEQCVGDECIGECKENNDCPFNWQRCIFNKCADICTLLKCANCKYGICGYQEPSQPCLSDGDCRNQDHSCVNRVCLDKCIKTRCQSGFTCINGICRALE